MSTTDVQLASAFSADLPTLASEHIRFLQKIHSLGISLSRPLKETLRRYRDLWLPLVQSLPNETLIPPPDIAWLWHCHRLAPFRYETYLQTRFGADCPILEAKPPFTLQVSSEERDESMSSTEHFWESMFPREPFFLPESTHLRDGDSNDDAPEEFLFNGFDLLGSAERQATFLWQVSGLKFSDPSFLEEGISNYYRFLALKQVPEAKEQTLVPTYQIDLFWHTHILSNMTMYHEDCRRIIGTRLHHDDSLNDRTKGGTLDTAFEATSKLWMKQYGEAYHVEGGMYRGKPPPSYYSKDWSNSVDNGDFVAEWPVDSLNNLEANKSTNSSGPESESPVWTDIYGMTNDGELGFIPANEKSNDPSFNTNPQKEGYIFGNGSRGWGYYHHTTCEAYVVLKARLEQLIEKKEEDIEILECLSCCCCCGRRLDATRKAEEKLEKLKQAKEAAYDRIQLEKPFFKAKTPQDHPKTDASRKPSDDGQDVVEYLMLPLDYVTLAGGCGATPELFEGAACGGGFGGFDGDDGGGFDGGGFDAGGFDAGGIDLGGFSF